MNSRLLTVAADNPARFASFRCAVVVKHVGEDPRGRTNKRVLGRLTRSMVSFATLPFNSLIPAALHSSSSGRPLRSQQHAAVNLCKTKVVIVEVVYEHDASSLRSSGIHGQQRRLIACWSGVKQQMAVEQSGCWHNDGWLRGLPVNLLRYQGEAVVRSGRYKCTSDAFEFM
eukprot:6192553-Pleurochrysis_carterae.AAC.1